MRQGIGCVLCEAEAGSLAEVRRCLAGMAVRLPRCRHAGSAAQESAAGETPGRRDCGASRGTRSCRGGAARGRRRRRLALCRQDDAKALSLAASSGFDDLLIMPFDPVELVRRLQTLAAFAALGAERGRRTRLFAAYRDEVPRASRSPTEHADQAGGGAAGQGRRPSGPGGGGVAAGERHLPREPRSAACAPARERVDLLLVTQPALIVAALEAIEAADERAADAARGPCRPADGAGAAAAGRSAAACRHRCRWRACRLDAGTAHRRAAPLAARATARRSRRAAHRRPDRPLQPGRLSRLSAA